jgi:RNase P subunit RPR2
LPAFRRVVLKKRLWGEKVVCAKCGRLLLPGEVAWEHRHEGRLNAVYCNSCYERLWK